MNTKKFKAVVSNKITKVLLIFLTLKPKQNKILNLRVQ